MIRWPWQREPTLAPAPMVDVEAVATRAAEAAATAVAERAATETAELLRGLVANSPLGNLVPQSAGSAFPLYAFDRPFTYATPQAPTKHPGSLVTVDMLRQLADTYDVLRSCIQHLKREVLSVPLQITPRDDSDTSDAAKARQQQAREWFETDGGLGGVGMERATFEGMLLEDLLVVGAGAVYYHPTRGGQLHAAHVVDAATIRPRVDAFGWPGPGEKAYEQWIYGVMVADFTRDELRYAGLPTNARSYTPYFASPVEYLVHTVNTALRSDHWNRSWLTDGNTPSDLIALPESWTPPQIKEFATWWDSLLTGNTQGRQKTRFVPGGTGRVGNPSRKDQDFAVFELWLLRRTCAIMGVQPASIGFVGEQYKVTQGESMTATTQFGAGPLLDYRKSLYDDCLKRRSYGDLEAKNVTQQEEGAKERAERNKVRIESGQATPNEARAEDGLDPLEGGDTLFISSSLVPVEHAAKPPEPATGPAGEPSKAGAPAKDADRDPGATERVLRQWERKALNRLRSGKDAECDFQSDVLSPDIRTLIRAGLGRCSVAEDVRGFFGAILRVWNAADHPRDEKGRFAATGGVDSVRVSWEATPGKSTGHLPGIHTATYEQRAEYTRAIAHALKDEHGNDRLAQALGLEVRTAFEGPGLWEGDSNPSVQVAVKAPAGPLHPDLQKKVEEYGAAIGLALKQEGVGYHKIVPATSLEAANAVRVSMGRSVTPAEAEALYNKVREHTDDAEVANGLVVISDRSGFRALNFTGKSNEEFRTLLVKGIEGVLPEDLVVELDHFVSDGDVIGNDWEKNPNGEDYRQRLDTAGRSDLSGALSDVLSAVAQVDQRFQEKYGWHRAEQTERQS